MAAVGPNHEARTGQQHGHEGLDELHEPGRLEGEVHTTGQVIVGEEGIVTGTIHAGTVINSGKILETMDWVFGRWSTITHTLVENTE